MSDQLDNKIILNRYGDPVRSGRPTILLVSADERPYINILPTLGYSYQVEKIDQGHAALDFLKKSTNIKAAIIDSDLPGLTGFQVAKRCYEHRTEDDNLAHIPIMLVGQSVKDIDAIDRLKEFSDAVAFTPFSDGEFLSSLWELCDKASEQNWEKLNYAQSSVLKVTRRNLEKIFDISSGGGCKLELVKECSNAVVDAAESNDLDGVLKELRNHHSYSFVHNLKVSSLMTIFGNQLGMQRVDLQTLAQGGLLHDIGKSMTPAGLLDKPGPLTDDEWTEMKMHVTHSGDMMRADGNIPQEIINVAERHHEKIDGTGYPYGLKGAQLDDLSLIAAIADVYSALTDKRSYKPAMEKEKVIEIMTSMRGAHLEEGFVNKFIEMLQEGAFH